MMSAFHPLRTLPLSATMFRMRIVRGLILFAVCVGCSAAPPPTTTLPTVAVPVEVWTGGDDGLTQRLGNAMRDEFRRSGLFTLAPTSTSHSLRVTIPTHVGWQEVGGKTLVTYKLRLARGERYFGETGGVCWENDLRTCARQVVQEATNAIAR